MDNYKHIEALLDKYWACRSDLEEEKTLREFFTREQALPAHLQQYCALFSYQQEEKDVCLPADFETKLLEKITKLPHSRTIPQSHNRISFFSKAAAGFLLLLSTGFFMYQHRQTQKQAAARETVITAIELLADNLQQGETMIDEGLKHLEILFTD
jgi:hypothetical protein